MKRRTSKYAFLTRIKNFQLVFFIISAFAFGVAGQNPSQTECESLPIKAIEKQIGGTQTHCYQIKLEKDDFFQVKVEQKEIDLLLQLKDLDGKELVKIDGLSIDEEPEILSFIAETSGLFQLKITRSTEDEENPSQGSYAIRLEVLRKSVENDRRQIIAERERQNNIEKINKILDEALKLKDEIKSSISTNPFEQSLEKANEALKISESLKIPEFQIVCVFFIATIYEENSDVENATRYYEKTVELSKSILKKGSKSLNMEIYAIKNLGRTYYFEDRFNQAIVYLFRGLELYKENQEDENKGIILRFIADCYLRLGNYSEAEKYYRKAQTVFKNLQLPLEEGVLLNKWGQIYLEQGNRIPEALAKFLEAEKLLENSPIKTDTYDRKVFNLLTISHIYNDLKDVKNSKLYEEKANKAVDNVSDYKVFIMNYLTQAQKLFAEENYKESIKECEKILDLTQKYKIQDVFLVKSQTYRLLIYSLLLNEEGEKAKKYLDEWFNLVKDLPDKSYLARFFQTLANLFEGEDSIKSIKTSINLILSQKDENKEIDYNLLAILYNDLGTELLESKKNKEALNAFRNSLKFFLRSSNKSEIADYLSELMEIYNSVGLPRLAILLGKISVSYKQESRFSLKTLSIQDQKLFLAGNRETYEILIDLMIKEGKFTEAQQIINLFQTQEFYDFYEDKDQTSDSLYLALREREPFENFQKLQNEITKLANSIENIKVKSLKRTLKTEEKQELDALELKSEEMSVQIEELITKLEVDFSKADENDRTEIVKDTLEMNESMNLLNKGNKKHAAIYTVATRENLYLLLITGEKNAPVKAFSYPVKTEDLNKKIGYFLSTLKIYTRDPYQRGNEIYKMIFRAVSTVDQKTTLEAELEKYGANVLHWSLDGNLRYIPIPALSDENKQFVVEKYETTVFTRADKEVFRRKPQKLVSGLGFGTSEAYLGFTELVNVPIELKKIFGKGGLMRGNFLLDKKFTETEMIKLIENAKPKPSFIHFSSHFKFVEGDARNSFLLLGAGNNDEREFSLYDMQKHSNLFKGVDLVLAAACETANFKADNNGKEIDAFAELAQRLGASSVIATLWKVDDAGTSQLVTDFYRLYGERIKKTPSDLPAKSEILRQAQLQLLKRTKKDAPLCVGGTVKSDINQSDIRGSDLDQVDDGQIYEDFVAKNPQQPCEHPYFWSPFVLYGSPQ